MSSAPTKAGIVHNFCYYHFSLGEILIFQKWSHALLCFCRTSMTYLIGG